jgi:plastocyanin
VRQPNSQMRALTLSLMFGVTVALSSAAPVEAQSQLLSNTTVINFGPVNSTAPPMSAPLHVVVPDEVTIAKGETVTFMVNGGGHGVAIYPVSAHTTRADIIAGLCTTGPGCGLPASQAAFLVKDHKGDVIIDIPADTTVPPIFDYAPGRAFGVIGGIPGPFLNGAPGLATPPAQGVRFQYQFEKTGRFLVICMNRVHSISDHMFGFVTVVGGPK